MRDIFYKSVKLNIKLPRYLKLNTCQKLNTRQLIRNISISTHTTQTPHLIMIRLFRHVKCEKPLFVGLVRRYFFNPLVAGMQLTH